MKKVIGILMVAMATVLLTLTAISFANTKREFKKSENVNFDKKRRCVLENLATSGLGDVKYSILTEEQFQAVNGNEWVLMKGQTMAQLGVVDPEGTVFNYMTGETHVNAEALPDSTNNFLRANSGDKGRKIGEFQGFMTSHIGLGYSGNGKALSGGAHDHEIATYNLRSQCTGCIKSKNADLSFTNEPFASNHPAHTSFSAKVNSANSCKEACKKNGCSNCYVHSTDWNYSGSTARALVDGAHEHTLSLPAITSTATETRPNNIAINVFVKIKRKCRVDADPCDVCLSMDDSTEETQHLKAACLHDEIEAYESSNRFWQVSCAALNIGTAKYVYTKLGDNIGVDEKDFLDHLDNQYPYYNANQLQSK